MEAFITHYKKIEPQAQKKLKEFSNKKNKTHKELLEELTFCIFAANSSAKMGLLASQLLKDTMHQGSLTEIKQKVHKKVRFYNKRSEYLHYNREYIKKKHETLPNLIKKFQNPNDLRLYIKKNLKGFGMKESSHFLRNIGYKGFTIIDKHVLSVIQEIGLRHNTPPKNEQEYLEIETTIIQFAQKNNLQIDILDLAFWSYRTGEIIK